MINAIVPELHRHVFGLGIPETIGCREAMWLVNHPEADIQWQRDEPSGIVSTRWERGAVMRYSLQMIPTADYVDMIMTIENLSVVTYHEVFAFNCVSPARAPEFKDPSLTRTYLSRQGQPTPLAHTTRRTSPRPTIDVYATQRHGTALPPFAEAFEATSPESSDGSWMAIVSETGDAYLGVTTPDALFLFHNTALGCIHAAPYFGGLSPGQHATVTSRVYVSTGTLQDFRERAHADRMAGSAQ